MTLSFFGKICERIRDVRNLEEYIIDWYKKDGIKIYGYFYNNSRFLICYGQTVTPEQIEKIRTKLLKDNHIDTVIGLPSNLFYSTGIPVCILVLKKCKKEDDVLFINASENFNKEKRQNTLAEEHIENIVETYQYRNERERYSRRVSMEEIENNDYNLNISRYVSTAEDEIQIDLKDVNAKLLEINKTIESATKEHNMFLKELGLEEI